MVVVEIISDIIVVTARWLFDKFPDQQPFVTTLTAARFGIGRTPAFALVDHNLIQVIGNGDAGCIIW